MDLDLTYRGEGNANIVFINRKKRIVYRILKSKSTTVHDIKEQCRLEEKILNLTSYIKFVITPVMNMAHLNCDIVKLSEDHLCHLQKKVASFLGRPEHRLGTNVNKCAMFALKMPDYCYIKEQIVENNHVPTFAVELKLKEGFLIRKLQGAMHDTCKFCLKQNIKMKGSCINSLSGYCPMDIFSGNIRRMKHALKKLFETPQNNLRLFKDGSLLFSEEERNEDFFKEMQEHLILSDPDVPVPSSRESVVDFLCDVIIECLVRPLQKKTVCEVSLQGKSSTSEDRNLIDHEEKAFSAARNGYPPTMRLPTYDDYRMLCRDNLISCKNSQFDPSVVTELPEGCVLAELLAAQSLGVGGLCRVLPLYRQLEGQLEDPGLERHKEQTLFSGPYENFLKLCTAFDTPTLNEAVDQLRRYMVSRTMSDCSLMIALQRLPRTVDCTYADHAHQVVRDCHGNVIQFQIGVVDLDPKELSRCMDKWTKEAQELDKLCS